MVKKNYIPKPNEAGTKMPKRKVRKETLKEKAARGAQWTIDKLNRAETHEETTP